MKNDKVILRPRKKRKTWKMLTVEQRVSVVYLLLKQTPRPVISNAIGCSITAIARLQRIYCDVTVSRNISLKKNKKYMAKLLELHSEEPNLL